MSPPRENLRVHRGVTVNRRLRGVLGGQLSAFRQPAVHPGEAVPEILQVVLQASDFTLSFLQAFTQFRAVISAEEVPTHGGQFGRLLTFCQECWGFSAGPAGGPVGLSTKGSTLCPSSTSTAYRVVVTLTGFVPAVFGAKIAALAKNLDSFRDNPLRGYMLLNELLETLDPRRTRIHLAIGADDEDQDRAMQLDLTPGSESDH